ncbi:hypothetical protein ES319_D10G075500v1 [Gossypium barbadense]|uniref:Uncharacterized protein n=1 Tax=Gossypium barbadense TaxID=3634 RepID=A0A5J5PMS1_GOSBA|nr:hypothetical protein ES319_D10G075500v1 [Gossypium barbadense]PPD72102.1 hypothetical protein GOBAR_DD30996 [Gossypium barbadense]
MLDSRNQLIFAFDPTEAVEDRFLLVSTKAWNGHNVHSHTFYTLFRDFEAVYPYRTKNYILKFDINYFHLKLIGAARTQAPTATNYDVGSPSWGDLKAAPLPSAMEVTALGHESS